MVGVYWISEYHLKVMRRGAAITGAVSTHTGLVLIFTLNVPRVRLTFAKKLNNFDNKFLHWYEFFFVYALGFDLSDI